LRRPADNFIVPIDTKFKVFRIRFIFYFKIVFIKNFLKMAPIRVRFSQGFLQEQDFLESNLIRADHVGKKTVFRGTNCSSVALEVRRSTPLRTVNLLEQPPKKICPGEELLQSSRSTLEQIPPQESLLLEEIPQ
jgi:hypothetical protein